jgi:hypothetical protein
MRSSIRRRWISSSVSRRIGRPRSREAPVVDRDQHVKTPSMPFQVVSMAGPSAGFITSGSVFEKLRISTICEFTTCAIRSRAMRQPAAYRSSQSAPYSATNRPRLLNAISTGLTILCAMRAPGSPPAFRRRWERQRENSRTTLGRSVDSDFALTTVVVLSYGITDSQAHEGFADPLRPGRQRRKETAGCVTPRTHE